MKERRRNGYEQREADRNMRPQKKNSRQYDRQRAQDAPAGKKSACAKRKRARNKEFARVTYRFCRAFLSHDGIYILF